MVYDLHSFTDSFRSRIRNALFFAPPFEPGEQLPDVAHQRKSILPHLADTPFFLMDGGIVRERLSRLYRALGEVWGERHAVALSFKTNYGVAASRAIPRSKVWAEVVSGWELRLADTLGYASGRTIFNGPVKRDDDLVDAVKRRCTIHVDGMTQLHRFAGLVSGIRAPVRVGLRIHCNIPGLTESRFGSSVDRGEAHAAVGFIRTRPNLKLTSLHMHIGTDVDSVAAYAEASEVMSRFCRDAGQMLGYGVEMIDMGGGFPSSAPKPFEREYWNPAPIEEYIRAIAFPLARYPETRDTLLLIEPGRYLSDDAFVFVSSVYDSRFVDRVQQVVTDGTLTMLPLKHYRPMRVKVFTAGLAPRPGGAIFTRMYGGSCREDDLIHEGRFPLLVPGDKVVYYGVGAYNQSMGSDFIFGKPKNGFDMSPFDNHPRHRLRFYV